MQYRPRQFSELFGVDYLKRAIETQLTNGRCRMLFTGPNGFGKSTIARVVLLRFFCESPNGLDACLTCPSCDSLIKNELYCDCLFLTGDQLDGSSAEQIEKRLYWYPNILSIQSVLIDDADIAASSVLLSLNRLLVEWPAQPFLVTATDTRKIPLSFAQRFINIPIRRLDVSALEQLIRIVCRSEGVRIGEEEGVKALIYKSCFNPRTILHGLEIIKGEGNTINREVMESEVLVYNLEQQSGEALLASRR